MEFCSDIWREIKSYLFVYRKRGNKCDYCDSLWTKRYCDKERYLEIVQDGEVIDEKLFWAGVNSFNPFIGEIETRMNLKHYCLCDKCWNRKLLDYDTSGVRFEDEFFEYFGKTKKYINILAKIYLEEFLLQKHRLKETRNIQEKALEILENAVKRKNKYKLEVYNAKIEETKRMLEKRRRQRCANKSKAIFKEINGRKAIKEYNEKKISYVELIIKINKYR
jgi:hypothetical protein